jgi:hypothetical protein
MDARALLDPRQERHGLPLLAAGAFAALVIRAAVLARVHPNFDTTAWQIVVDILRRGGDLYRETERYNYSPLWAGVLYGLAGLADALGVSFVRTVAVFLTLVDVGTAAVIWRIGVARGRTPVAAGWLALLFFANPVSVLVSSQQVMFDGLSILFLLLALWAAERKSSSPTATVGFLSLSLLAKHITWFHPLLFAARRREPRLKWTAALSPYLVFLLSFLPFWRSWEGIRAHVFGYRGLDEVYGTEPLRFVTWLPRETTTVLFVLAALAAVGLLRRVELGRASLMLFLVILIFTPGICPYYFVWPVALGALYPGVGFAVYTAVVTAFFIHSPDVLAQEIAHLPGWWGVWWAVVLWLLWELQALRKRPPESMSQERS